MTNPFAKLLLLLFLNPPRGCLPQCQSTIFFPTQCHISSISITWQCLFVLSTGKAFSISSPYCFTQRITLLWFTFNIAPIRRKPSPFISLFFPNYSVFNESFTFAFWTFHKANIQLSTLKNQPQIVYYIGNCNISEN